MPSADKPISKKERARKRLRWSNRKRKLAGLSPELDKRKAEARARKKRLNRIRIRRKSGFDMSRRRPVENAPDARLRWVRKRIADGTWVKPALHRKQKEHEELDRLLAMYDDE